MRQSAQDKVVVVGSGVTLTEALKAADQLGSDGVNICVIDLFTIKPLDRQTILENAVRVGGKVLTVEDHYPAGELTTFIDNRKQACREKFTLNT